MSQKITLKHLKKNCRHFRNKPLEVLEEPFLRAAGYISKPADERLLNRALAGFIHDPADEQAQLFLRRISRALSRIRDDEIIWNAIGRIKNNIENVEDERQSVAAKYLARGLVDIAAEVSEDQRSDVVGFIQTELDAYSELLGPTRKEMLEVLKNSKCFQDTQDKRDLLVLEMIAPTDIELKEVLNSQASEYVKAIAKGLIREKDGFHQTGEYDKIPEEPEVEVDEEGIEVEGAMKSKKRTTVQIGDSFLEEHLVEEEDLPGDSMETMIEEAAPPGQSQEVSDPGIPIRESDMEEVVERKSEESLVKEGFGRQKEVDGALMAAASKGKNRVLKRLLAQGANPNAIGEGGKTALIIAAQENKLKAVKLLVEAGAYVNVQDEDGLTALILASGKGNRRMVEFLIGKGADPSIKSKDGLIAQDIAFRSRRVKLARFLGQYVEPAVVNISGESKEEVHMDSILCMMIHDPQKETIGKDKEGREVSGLLVLQSEESKAHIDLSMLEQEQEGVKVFNLDPRTAERIAKSTPPGQMRWGLPKERGYPVWLTPITEINLSGRDYLVFDTEIKQEGTIRIWTEVGPKPKEIGSLNSNHSIMEMLLHRNLPRSED
jgi:hypothetical protein